jgi:hypothetical protein
MQQLQQPMQQNNTGNKARHRTVQTVRVLTADGRGNKKLG